MEEKVNKIIKLTLECDNYKQLLKDTKEKINELEDEVKDYLKKSGLTEVNIGDKKIFLKPENPKLVINMKFINPTPQNSPSVTKTFNILDFEKNKKKNKPQKDF